MAASSTTGTGLGNSRKLTPLDLAIIANGPAIYAVGTVELVSEEEEYSATVTLPVPLPGRDSYSIFLTFAEGEGSAWVSDMMDDDDFNLTGFVVGADAEGTVNYMVVKKGFRNP